MDEIMATALGVLTAMDRARAKLIFNSCFVLGFSKSL
jgi:hypothetical protein